MGKSLSHGFCGGNNWRGRVGMLSKLSIGHFNNFRWLGGVGTAPGCLVSDHGLIKAEE